MLASSLSRRPTPGLFGRGRRIAQIVMPALLAAHIGVCLTTPARAEAQDVCRDLLRTIDVEAVTTNDPRALVRLAPSIGSQAIPALLQRTTAADEEIAFAAFLAIGLSRHAEALRSLRDAPRPKSPVVRLGRSLALLAIGDGSETTTITHALYEGTVGERRRTAVALARMRQKRPQMILYDSMEDPDELVRLTAARVLIRAGSYRARKVLVELFKSGSTSEIKNRAARSLLRAQHGFRPEELAQLTPAQKLRSTIGDAARGRKISLRQLSAQIRSADPIMRAAAFAAIALTGVETPAQMKKLERTLAPSPETSATLALLNEPNALKALESLDKPGAERAAAVMIAYAAAGAVRAQLDPEHAGQIARVAEGWISRDLLEDAVVSRLISAIERFDSLAGLLVSRARIGGEDGQALRKAIRVIGRSGSLVDLGPLAELAKKGSPSTRSEALRAGARVCSR